MKCRRWSAPTSKAKIAGPSGFILTTQTSSLSAVVSLPVVLHPLMARASFCTSNMHGTRLFPVVFDSLSATFQKRNAWPFRQSFENRY